MKRHGASHGWASRRSLCNRCHHYWIVTDPKSIHPSLQPKPVIFKCPRPGFA
jgi:hypothetical protein